MRMFLVENDTFDANFGTNSSTQQHVLRVQIFRYSCALFKREPQIEVKIRNVFACLMDKRKPFSTIEGFHFLHFAAKKVFHSTQTQKFIPDVKGKEK